MKPDAYPFAAIVGQEPLKLALLLAAVDPSLGGVLVSGHKGTGKTTAVRALRGLLPEIEVVEGCPYRCAPDDLGGMDAGCLARLRAGETLRRARVATPMVELPLNATEDRLAGTLDVQRALAGGERRFEPGLLAAANRGVLYVDEVNLLEDHLVDMLLDAAVSGVNVVEREGVSHSHAARFVLLGTMNPEEGSLRPQFLDRFGLFTAVTGLGGLDERAQLVRRRLAFESDPAGFCAEWAEPQRELTERIVRARAGLRAVRSSDELTLLAVTLAAEAEVRGHRAEIAILKAARALAALVDRAEVAASDIADAARFVLPHRMRADALDSPERLEARLADLIRRVVLGGPAQPESGDASEVLEEENRLEAMQVPGSFAAGSIVFTFQKKSPKSG